MHHVVDQTLVKIMSTITSTILFVVIKVAVLSIYDPLEPLTGKDSPPSRLSPTPRLEGSDHDLMKHFDRLDVPWGEVH